jgi:hypothetical protein
MYSRLEFRKIDNIDIYFHKGICQLFSHIWNRSMHVETVLCMHYTFPVLFIRRNISAAHKTSAYIYLRHKCNLLSSHPSSSLHVSAASGVVFHAKIVALYVKTMYGM